MCLITKQKRAKRIEQDLIVYKVLISSIRNNEIRYYGLLMSNFEYKLNVLYKTKLKRNVKTIEKRNSNRWDSLVGKAYPSWIINPDVITISQGFHSFKSINRYFNNDLELKKQRIMENGFAKCVIPKGSLVYEDVTGLIVSDQIKLLKIMKEEEVLKLI